MTAACCEDVSKGKGASRAAASANQGKAEGVLRRAFLRGVDDLRAWLVAHRAETLRDVRWPVAHFPTAAAELLARPMVAAWEPVLTKATERAPFVQKERKDKPTRAASRAAARIAREQGASLVVDVTAKVQKAIRAIISKGINANWDIPRIARALEDTVGLHDRYALAVEKMRTRLYATPGVSAAQADRQALAYARRLLRSRALTIARTETAYAEQRGRYEGWIDAMVNGRLDMELRRKWVAGDPCPVCAELSTQPALPMLVPFRAIDGQSLMHPPAHPRCKCSIVLVKVAPGGGEERVVGAGTVRRSASPR